jgi:hypothetical protein
MLLALRRIAWAPDRTKQVYQRLLHPICDDGLAPGACTASALDAISFPSSPATCARCLSTRQGMRRFHATYASTT